MTSILDLASSSVGGMPYVAFHRIAIEDKAKSLEAGHYVARDVDMAHVTPPYSKDVMKHVVSEWIEQLKVDASNDRIPREWVDKYKNAYEAWKNGQELPLDGIPIRGWGVCSPAQQETLIKMHILTVEQLAEVTDEGLRRIGMGAVDLKNKADAWLKSLKKSGPLTLEMAALKKQNEVLSASNESLETRLTELTRIVEQSAILNGNKPMGAVLGISANDLMDED